ncbi:MAG TPA: two-component system response regulator NarL [Gammaproteobacteria bacterium]|jgi:two-component system nitrate/nitrite response regulator NarL|nr:two-component system response regulator NarL [Gammaproteobacteria bacterium]
MNLRILVIDDHTLFREGLQGLLVRRNIDVIAATGDGSEGVRLAAEHQPDIVLLDMRMPNTDGITVLKHLIENGMKMPIVILTTSSDERDLIEALRSGARGYLLKDMEPDELVAALRDIDAGKTVVAPNLTQILAEVVQGKSTMPDLESSPFDELTPRETEILGLLAEGQSNKVIARNLGISDGTVKLHVKAILRKLDVHSRVEAAVMAVEHGLRAANQQAQL